MCSKFGLFSVNCLPGSMSLKLLYSSVNKILSLCHLNLSKDSFIYFDFQEFRFVFRKLLEMNMEVPESFLCLL